jgi:hypothetical protein
MAKTAHSSVTNDSTSMTFIRIGYITIVCGLILNLLANWKNLPGSPWAAAWKVILPTTLTSVILIYISVITFIFGDELIQKTVPDNYYLYSNYFSFSIILQVILLLYNNAFNKDETAWKTTIIIYIFSIINIAMLIIMGTILQHFSTDG